jgi:hypothetical protein
MRSGPFRCAGRIPRGPARGLRFSSRDFEVSFYARRNAGFAVDLGRLKIEIRAFSLRRIAVRPAHGECMTDANCSESGHRVGSHCFTRDLTQ